MGEEFVLVISYDLDHACFVGPRKLGLNTQTTFTSSTAQTSQCANKKWNGGISIDKKSDTCTEVLKATRCFYLSSCSRSNLDFAVSSFSRN